MGNLGAVAGWGAVVTASLLAGAVAAAVVSVSILVAAIGVVGFVTGYLLS